MAWPSRSSWSGRSSSASNTVVGNPLRNNDVVAVIRELEGHGVKPEIELTGKHVKIKWQQAGRNLMITCSRSPSDHRSAMNARAQARRMLRENVGVAQR